MWKEWSKCGQTFGAATKGKLTREEQDVVKEVSLLGKWQRTGAIPSLEYICFGIEVTGMPTPRAPT